MNSISFYDPQGRITYTLQADEPTLELNRKMSTTPSIDGDWYGKPVYVRDGWAQPLPENPTRLEGFVLLSVPIPSTVYVNDRPYPTNESRVDLGFNQPGVYRVRVESWPYLDKEFSVENPA